MTEIPKGTTQFLEYHGFPAVNKRTWELLLKDCLNRQRNLARSGTSSPAMPSGNALRQMQFDFVMTELLRLLILQGHYTDEGLISGRDLTTEELGDADALVVNLMNRLNLFSPNAAHEMDADNNTLYQQIINIICSSRTPELEARTTRGSIEEILDRHGFFDLAEKGSFIYQMQQKTMETSPDAYFSMMTASLNTSLDFKLAARFFIHFEQAELAIRALKRALDLEPEDGESKKALVRLLYQVGRSEEANAIVIKVSKPKDPAVQLLASLKVRGAARFEGEKPEDFLSYSIDLATRIGIAKEYIARLEDPSRRQEVQPEDARRFSHMNEVLDRLGSELEAVGILVDGKFRGEEFKFVADDLKAMEALIERALEDSRSFDFSKETEATEAARKAIYMEMVEIVRRYIK